MAPGITATSGAATSLLPLPHVDEVSGDGCRGRHRGRHQMRAALIALPALEIAVRSRGATLAWRQLVRIHRETHRAARLAPVEAGGLEDLVQPFGFGLRFHQTGARHN